MKSKLEKLYLIVGVLDVLLGVTEIVAGRGHSEKLILGGGFIMIGFANLFSYYKTSHRQP